MCDGLTMSKPFLFRNSHSEQRSICLGTVTRDRPVMLRNLLSSYANLLVPHGVTLHFLIVENNEHASLTNIMQAFHKQVPQWTVQYVVEPKLGIASARNRVLQCALTGGHDLLTFADDDEVVDENWLANLLAERDRHDLDIVGSPVRTAPCREKLTGLQRLVWSGVHQSRMRAELRCLKKWNEGRADSIKLATGSWMAKLEFFRQTGLRFDSSLGLSGGEDWRLWSQAKALGARTGWTPHAIAYETIPAERLRLRYYYRRTRDHNATEIKARLKAHPIRTLVRLPGSILSRLLKFFIELCSLPATRGKALVSSASNLGGIVGLLQGCFGRKTMHYEKISGH